MRRVLLGLFVTLLALLPATAAARTDDGAFRQAMLRELNRMRTAHHLPTLRDDTRMDRGARAHSRDMARQDYFAHGAWAGRVAAAAGAAHEIGEVLGSDRQGSPHTEAVDLVRAWLASPEHRRVLLDGTFRRIGIGRATATRNGHTTALYTVDWASLG